jgi:hypothetical protein
MPNYLERYLAGEHEPVWAELQALGAGVRKEPLLTDAFAVAHETMRRVRRNIETLLPRLEAMGYRFYAHPTEYQPHVDPWGGSHPSILDDPPRLAQPDEEMRAQLDRIEREFGPLPISLCAFYEEVGAVNFVGQPPAQEGWHDGPTLDPLFIFGLRTTYVDWLRVRDNAEWRADYRPSLFPDFLLKYDFAGVGPIEITAPSATMDAPLWFEDGAMYGPDDEPYLFVSFLRFVLQRGGFAGATFDESPISEAIRLRLVEGLLPF